MNKRCFSMLRNVMAMLVISLVVIGLPSSGAVWQDGFDYIFVVETEHLKDEFEYNGSRIGPVVKVNVSYYKPGQTKPTRYENLWYHGWQVLGCKRFTPLALGNSQVAIEMRHKERRNNKAENAAGANAMLRVFLEVLMSKSSVSTFIVPDLDFGAIENEMGQASFYGGNPPEPDKPTNCCLAMPLRSSSGSSRRFLFYRP